MSSIDEVYCNRSDILPSQASILQKDVANLLCNFNVDSEHVTESIQRIQDAFLDYMGSPKDEKIRKIVGLVPTAQAFDIPMSEAISPSKRDTRITLVVGKPVNWVLTDPFTWSPCLEERFVVAMRIVDMKDVFFSKVYPSPKKRVIRPALGLRMYPSVLEEAKLISSTSCCEAVVDAGSKVFFETKTLACKAVDGMVDDAKKAFDSLVLSMETSLGFVSEPVPDTASLKRVNSVPLPPPKPIRCNSTLSLATVPPLSLPPSCFSRFDSEFVDSAAVCMKRKLGQSDRPLKLLKKSPSP